MFLLVKSQTWICVAVALIQLTTTVHSGKGDDINRCPSGVCASSEAPISKDCQKICSEHDEQECCEGNTAKINATFRTVTIVLCVSLGMGPLVLLGVLLVCNTCRNHRDELPQIEEDLATCVTQANDCASPSSEGKICHVAISGGSTVSHDSPPPPYEAVVNLQIEPGNKD